MANEKLKKLLGSQYTIFGDVFPPKAVVPFLSIDGRTAALHVLRDYVCNLEFFRYAGPNVPPTGFSILPANFAIEWPDYTKDEVFPSIAIIPARADYDVIGLVSYIEEDTRDLYKPGTVLQWQAEYVETIQLEIVASKKSERRAILSGIETAFSPTEQMSGLRFRMPEYYDELVCFTLMKRALMDTPDSARNRRVAQVEMQMRFNIVALVNATDTKLQVKVNTDVDMDTMQSVDLSTDPNARTVGIPAADGPPGAMPNPAFG